MKSKDQPQAFLASDADTSHHDGVRGVLDFVIQRARVEHGDGLGLDRGGGAHGL